MKSDRKANLLVFLTIAIVALGLSSISAAFTGDLFTTSLPGMNSSDKMIALDDDGFSPNAVSTYKEEVEVEDKNETNETVDDSDSNITNEDSDNSEIEVIALSPSLVTIEHYFDNTVDERIVKVYGDFLLDSLDISNLNTSIIPVAPIVVDELISQSNGNSLQGLFLMEETYSVNLQGSLISDLTPIGGMNLETLDLRNARFSSISVLDDYLVYIVEHYGTRRACTVYLSIEPSSVGYAAIDTILNEDEWNQYENWSFIINGAEYVPN